VHHHQLTLERFLALDLGATGTSSLFQKKKMAPVLIRCTYSFATTSITQYTVLDDCALRVSTSSGETASPGVNEVAILAHVMAMADKTDSSGYCIRERIFKMQINLVL
jgi:hypothetical protein